MDRRGCLQSFIPFILILCLLLSLSACDVASILNRLRSEVSGSENITNDFSSGSMDESYIINGDGSTSITILPGEGSGLISGDGYYYISGDGASAEGVYTVVDGYLIAPDGTVIGKVESFESEQSGNWGVEYPEIVEPEK